MISINLNIFIAQLLTFLAALFIIWKFSWGPLVSMMKQRKEKIKGDLDSAENMKKEAEQGLKSYQEKLLAFEKEKEYILSKAKEEAEQAKEEIVRLTQREVSDLREKMLIEIRDEQNAMMKQVRNEIINTAIQITEKVLHENDGKMARKDRFEQMLEYLEKNGEGKVK